MTSAGGLVAVADAADAPGGVAALGAGGRRAGRGRGRRRVRLSRRGRVRHGRHEHRRVPRFAAACPSPRRSAVVGGFPIRLPALDIHTIGAGGGSIARIDAGGALTVGPRQRRVPCPGPAVLRTRRHRADRDRRRPRARPHRRSGRRFPVSAGSTSPRRARALERAGVHAAGVVAVVDAAMEQAVRAVTVERGVDPSRARAVAFGGAGPLHACAIADALGMAAVIVPPRAGVLLGGRFAVLTAPRRKSCSPSARRLAAAIDAARADVARARRALVGRRRDDRDRGRLPLRRAEPRDHGADAGRLRGRARTPQRPRAARTRRSRWSRCGRARPPPRRSR